MVLNQQSLANLLCGREQAGVRSLGCRRAAGGLIVEARRSEDSPTSDCGRDRWKSVDPASRILCGLVSCRQALASRAVAAATVSRT